MVILDSNYIIIAIYIRNAFVLIYFIFIFNSVGVTQTLEDKGVVK